MGVSVGLGGRQSSGRGFTEFERFELGGSVAYVSGVVIGRNSVNGPKKKDITLFLSARNSSCLILSVAASIRSRAGVITF